jgi:hypothetical protein
MSRNPKKLILFAIALAAPASVLILGAIYRPQSRAFHATKDEQLDSIATERMAHLEKMYPFGCVIFRPLADDFVYLPFENSRDGFSVDVILRSSGTYVLERGWVAMHIKYVELLAKGGKVDVYNGGFNVDLPLKNGAIRGETRLGMLDYPVVLEVLDENHEAPVFAIGLRED